MQDVEFTVEEGRLFLLQTRVAKRPAQAAVRFAVDAVAEGLLSREEALLTIDAAGLVMRSTVAARWTHVAATMSPPHESTHVCGTRRARHMSRIACMALIPPTRLTFKPKPSAPPFHDRAHCDSRCLDDLVQDHGMVKAPA